MFREKCGLDLDGCVYDFHTEIGNFLIDFGVKIDKNSYDLGLNRKQVNFYLKEFSKSSPFLWIPLYKGVKEQINKLNNRMDFYIVTHRDWYQDGQSETIERLKKDRIPYEEVIFSNNKEYWANNLNLDYFIEDNLNNANKIANKSKTIVFLLNRTYNQGKTNKNIIRINSLEELL